MFQLSILKDSVCIPPKHLGKPLSAVIKRELTKKYANRIVHGLGLAITVHDIVSIGDPIVYPGEGAPFVSVTFELVVFKPFEYEVLEGKVRSSSETGIHISMGFFDDVFLPSACMQPDSHFDPGEQLWYWMHDGKKAYLDLNERIRFRVYADQFIERPPLPKGAHLVASSKGIHENTSSTQRSTSMPYYIIYASIAEEGLGLLSWWGGTN